jgi:hypothetical protein
MVLVCHPKRFIFMKTHKTASTSVEMYFERFCMPEHAWRGTEAVPETVSELGIVGSRRDGRRNGDTWYNHVPAARVRELLGAEVWGRYFKFATVRDPFAQVLSSFLWRTDTGLPADEREFDRVRRHFARFVRGGGLFRRRTLANDLGIVAIDGRVAMDGFVRFERLAEDVAAICRRLDLPWRPEWLPHTKKARGDAARYPLRDYYTPELAQIVAREFEWLFARCDYAREPGA